MPEITDLLEPNRKHLIGRLVTSTVSRGRIADISMPGENQFKHMLVLSAADFASCPYIRIMDDEIPIFAQDQVYYKGQPVLAVFGYDSEDVDLFCQEVKVSYQISADPEENRSRQYGEPFIWSYGNPDDFFTEDARIFKSSFHVAPFSNTMLGDQRVYAVKNNGTMIIRCSTQWPAHVKKTVAQVLGCRPEDIILNAQNYYAPYDQLVIQPTAISCIAAMAAEQTGELVQLCNPMISWQPEMHIEHETAYQQNGTPVADRATCTVDLGAFPIFTTEVCHNILAGLVSIYPMKAAEACITIMRSPSFPANFFGDLGFSMALAATENHFNNLALSLGIQPGNWRHEQLKDIGNKGFPLSESVKVSSDFTYLDKSLQSVMKDSWFGRKHAANTQKRLYSGKLNPLINYSRGVGLACGEGIMGFSQQFNSIARYSLSVTLTEEGKLIVNAGIQADRTMTGIWKNTIRQLIDIPEDNIIFLDINDPEIRDIGPSTLSRKMGIVSTLLIQACSDLEHKREFSRLPITVNTEYDADFTDPFYYSTCNGSVAIDLHIDTVMLAPVIDHIWVNIHMGHVFKMDRLLNKARHTITTVLSDICPRTSGYCTVDITIDQEGDFNASSLTAGLRGLVTAALVAALSQALGHTIRRIPVTSEDILGIATMNTQEEKLFKTTAGAEK